MKNKILDYMTIVLGLALVAFSVSTIIAPNKIVQGGVSGIAIIIYYLTNLQISITNLIVNIILIVAGVKILGKKFIINTLVSVLILSGFLELFSYLPVLINDIFLAAVFGGLLYGFGIGLTLIKGASSGGTDIAGRICQYFFSYLPIGKLLLIIDSLVILAGYIAFRDINLVLYGVITIIVSSFSIDFLIKKLNISKIAFVITEKGDEIATKLVTTSHRGVTKICVTGGYTEENKMMLMCALKEQESTEFQKKINEIDPDAFTIFSESQQIVGNGFHIYK